MPLLQNKIKFDKSSRSINLDVLRIMAAFLVLSTHIGQYTNLNFGLGASGVQLFFIMSGYLSYVSMENRDYKEYYKNRIIRIIPEYYFCLVLIYLKDFCFELYKTNSIQQAFAGQCSYRFIRYFLFLNTFSPTDNWDLWNNHNDLWTMSCFAFFYFLVPIIYKFINSFKKSLCLLTSAIIVRQIIAFFLLEDIQCYPEISHIEWYAYMNPFTSLYCFIFGVTLYLAIKQSHKFAYILILIITQLLFKFKWFPFEAFYTILVMLAIVFPIRIDDKIMRVITFFSKGSFTLYLIHPLLLTIFPNIWLHFLAHSNKYVYTAFLYIIIIFISYVIYYGGVTKLERKIISFEHDGS